MLYNVSLNTPIACSLVCFSGMTSSLAKVNKSSGAHFLVLFLIFPNFLMFFNIQIDLLILKTYYGQFTLTTKNHCMSSLTFILIIHFYTKINLILYHLLVSAYKTSIPAINNIAPRCSSSAPLWLLTTLTILFDLLQ